MGTLAVPEPVTVVSSSAARAFTEKQNINAACAAQRVILSGTMRCRGDSPGEKAPPRTVRGFRLAALPKADAPLTQRHSPAGY